MTVIARRIAAIPVRLASEAWEKIVDLLAPTNTRAREELLRAKGVAASLITRESMRESPIIVSGQGPRLRFYCVYGEKAIEGTGVNETVLPASPAESDDWSVSLPCLEDDLTWVQSALAQVSSRIKVRNMKDEDLSDSDDEVKSAEASINRKSFLRP